MNDSLGTAAGLIFIFVLGPACAVFLAAGDVQPSWMIEHNIPFKRITLTIMYSGLIIGMVSSASIIGLVIAFFVGIVMEAIYVFMMVIWLLLAAVSVIRNLRNR